MQKRPEQERIRIEKIQYLEEKGVKPFGQRYDRTANSASSLTWNNSIFPFGLPVD